MNAFPELLRKGILLGGSKRGMIFSKLPLIGLLVRQTKEHTGLKMSLNFKLLLIILSVLLIGALTSSFLVLNLQRQQLIESSEAASTRASSALAASLEHAMMTSDQAMANVIAGSVVSQDDIERVHVMNPQGVVRVSSDPLEIGKPYDRNQAMCQGCHLNGDALTKRVSPRQWRGDSQCLTSAGITCKASTVNRSEQITGGFTWMTPTV